MGKQDKISNFLKPLFGEVDWDKEWEDAENRSEDERFENIKEFAKSMGCVSDDKDTIIKFIKYLIIEDSSPLEMLRISKVKH